LANGLGLRRKRKPPEDEDNEKERAQGRAANGFCVWSFHILLLGFCETELLSAGVLQ
jgi:hypothetical protein